MMALVTDDPFAAAAASAARLTALTGPHDCAVVLGSGWKPAADAIGATEAEVPLTELGGFPEPTVAGHTPTVRSVIAGPVRVLVFLGRVHLYEGLPPSTVVHGVRTAVLAGCRAVVLTNAAGGIRPGLSVGEPVLISDHLNLTGKSPLTGPPPPSGQRFVDLTDLYSPRLRALARDADPSLTEGVYAMLPGPHYETPAEITMLAGSAPTWSACRQAWRRSRPGSSARRCSASPSSRTWRPDWPGTASATPRWSGRPGLRQPDGHAAGRDPAPRLGVPGWRRRSG